MFGWFRRKKRSGNQETSRPAELGWIEVNRSIPLPTSGVPAPADLIAESEWHAARLLEAGAVDQHNGTALDALLDEMWHDARVALRSAADDQRAVDDRLVDQARARWAGARYRHAQLVGENDRRERLYELHYSRISGLPAPDPMPRAPAAVPDLD